ncbi:MAG: uL15 family ribosomal protein [Patescibacteria group bacterium]|nr:uL15 family ribosomal protein [Patescibacteria group bacterium]
MMQLHQIKPTHKRKTNKRIGRGGKRGTYSGRGVKGQRSRAGRQMVPPIRQLIKKYPKLRGYKFKSRKKKPVIINIKILEEKFEKGDLVSPKTLLDKKLIRRIRGRLPKVKILALGSLTKKLTIEKIQVSKLAEDKIKKSGGIIK